MKHILPILFLGAVLWCGSGCNSTDTTTSFSKSLVKKVDLTTDVEGGSARPEIIATADRIYVVYLGNISAGSNRTFCVKIFDSDLVTQIVSTTLVTTNVDYGGPTDIRVASDGQSLFAFYELYSDSTGSSSLWGAKYNLNDKFERTAVTATPIAVSKHLVNPPDGHELLDDPALLIGPDSVFVVTRYNYSIAMVGNTGYRVREFSRDTLVQLSDFDLDLSSIADGRGRVTSLFFWNDSIYMALATTVSDQGINEANDDGALSDIILVKMQQDWTFNAQADVRTISAESDDRETYITGLRADGTHFYLTYKQAVGSPPDGEQRAVIKIFDNSFNLLNKEIVKSVIWGPDGGEIRPSLEVSVNRIFFSQSAGQGLGTGNAEIYVYEMR